MSRTRLYASLSCLLLFGGLGAFGCSGNVESHAAGAGGTKNDARGAACETSADCGALSCLCGRCHDACDGVSECSLTAGDACLGDASDVSAPNGNAVFHISLDDRDGADLALGPDYSLFVVGGQTPLPGDLGSVTFQDFWLARFDASGSVLWETGKPQEPQSPGVSVSFDGDGILTTLSTEYVDGPRTTLKHFDANGSATSDETQEREYVVTRSLPTSAGTWLAGYELTSETDGMPFMAPYVQRDGSPKPEEDWGMRLTGLIGGVSTIVSLALDEAGNASVSGYSGTDTESNRSVPLLARISTDGSTLFEHRIAVSEDGHCSADSVAVTPSGTTLAAGYCEGNWLKAFSPNGALLWERRFPQPISALAATDDGYWVATGIAPYPHETFNPDDDYEHAELLAFDAEHRLLYRVTEDGCAPFHRLVTTPDGVIALARRLGGTLLAQYQAPWAFRPGGG